MADAIAAIDDYVQIIADSTSAHFEMTGLDDFTKYYFRYAAITTKGTTDFCVPVAKVIG